MITTVKIFFITGLIILFFACNQNNNERLSDNGNCKTDSIDIANYKKQIIVTLDSFNIAAAKADFEKYFSYFTDDAVFIGTDAAENWNIENYKVWAKPYFDKRKTWGFKSFDRHVYFDETRNTAWFDELLNTKMKICRGSGVLIRRGKEWKIRQYVLSMTIPNSCTDTVIKIKATIENEIINERSKKH